MQFMVRLDTNLHGYSLVLFHKQVQTFHDKDGMAIHPVQM